MSRGSASLCRALGRAGAATMAGMARSAVFEEGARLTGALPLWRAPAASRATAEYPLGYLKSLDGMRGLMTLGVLGAHCGLYPRYIPGGVVLMQIFFAMSGFLITSLLVKDFERNGRIDFRKFYVRRFARLLPAFAVMLAVFLAFSAMFSNDFRARLVEAAISFFYIANYWVAIFWTPVPYTGHLWSLAVEEQFYLLWPMCFAVLLSRWGLSWRTVAAIALGAAAFATLRAVMTFAGAGIPQLAITFHAHADALLLGCATAVALRLVRFEEYPFASRLLAWSLVPLFVLVAVSIATIHPSMRWYYYVAPLFGGIPAVIAVAAVLQPHRTVMHRFYEWAPLVFCGRICYGLYIWHVPIVAGLWVIYGHAVGVLVGLPLTFLVATASYSWIERPFMRARPV